MNRWKTFRPMNNTARLDSLIAQLTGLRLTSEFVVIWKDNKSRLRRKYIGSKRKEKKCYSIARAAARFHQTKVKTDEMSERGKRSKLPSRNSRNKKSWSLTQRHTNVVWRKREFRRLFFLLSSLLFYFAVSSMDVYGQNKQRSARLSGSKMYRKWKVWCLIDDR